MPAQPWLCHWQALSLMETSLVKRFLAPHTQLKALDVNLKQKYSHQTQPKAELLCEGCSAHKYHGWFTLLHTKMLPTGTTNVTDSWGQLQAMNILPHSASFSKQHQMYQNHPQKQNLWQGNQLVNVGLLHFSETGNKNTWIPGILKLGNHTPSFPCIPTSERRAEKS